MHGDLEWTQACLQPTPDDFSSAARVTLGFYKAFKLQAGKYRAVPTDRLL
jgi:hypothetical protein